MRCAEQAAAASVAPFELLVTVAVLVFTVMAVLVVLERVARRTDELTRRDRDDEREP